MGHSQAEKAETRERILQAAARQIREGGLESVGIAELMKSVGQTHGGFYGHFKSRSALLTAALDRAIADGVAAYQGNAGSDGALSYPALVNAYVSGWHRDNPGRGCAISALANDTARADPPILAVMHRHLEQIFSETADLIGCEAEDDANARKEALTAWSTMVGAIALSRLFKGERLSDEILEAARTKLSGGAGR